MTRIDLWLFEKKIVRSRSQAVELIQQGVVFIQVEEQWKKISKPSYKIELDTSIESIKIEDSFFAKYVSRGGVKLESCLQSLKSENQFNVSGKKFLMLVLVPEALRIACCLMEQSRRLELM